MSGKRKGGAFRQREKNKKLLLAASSSYRRFVNMFKKNENNLVKRIVCTY
jgi:hypothetical protein